MKFTNRSIFTLAVYLLFALFTFQDAARAAQTNITGPAGSLSFGARIAVLPNGNIVVVDSGYSIPAGATNVGAVYLYDGATLALISVITGSTPVDNTGSGGITVLTNGNYVISSPNWNAGRGAATFCSAATGCSGVVSASNSLVGSMVGDRVGDGGITTLTNGNYVVNSLNWDNGAIANAGAVTFGSGTTGVSGTISSSNSLVGSTAGDQVGSGSVSALTNGNYVVRSPNWDNGTIVEAGAVTWGSGASGISGAISIVNSLVGSTQNSFVGSGGLTALTNGNYVVASPSWGNGANNSVGAATWGSGTTGITGAVSPANSLVGSTPGDNVGAAVTALTNGNYVVSSQNWDNGAIANAGAVTWGNGATGVSGTISAANSLVGSSTVDAVGSRPVVALTNGNYVVCSDGWDNGAIADAGAATFGNGTTGVSGTISSANSLVGSQTGDQVGISATALTNGNYVVRSTQWDNGAITDVGAATFGSGTTGISGTISSANSLIGSTAGDVVGVTIVALTNGNYVVANPFWDNGGVTNVGAVTFGNGTTGISGVVSAANSLIGSQTSDVVGNNNIGGVYALTNGNYVVASRFWNNGAIVDAGAVTFGNGTTGTTGTVSAANSLVGSTASDFVGNQVTVLTNGNYLVSNSQWNNGALTDAGAVTFGSGTTGISGAVSAANSLVGSTANDNVTNLPITPLSNGNYAFFSQSWDNGAIANAGAVTFGNGASGTVGAITNGASGGNSVVGTVSNGISNFAFDATRNRLIVGRSASNAISILFFTTTATADGDVGNAANWSNGVPNGLVSGFITGGRVMTISTKLNAGLIHVQCGGSLTGGSSSAYVIGSVRRDFCAAANESFTYPLGDANNYTPLTASNANGTGSLTASVTDNFLPGLPPARSLSRYWSLTGAGVTADLTFSYTDADVGGAEASYKAFKRNASTNISQQIFTSSVNAAANTFTAFSVSQFSDWSAGEAALAPTAANVSIGGRIFTPEGAGLRNAVVYLTKSDGTTLSTRSTSFGYYRFEGLRAGEVYTIGVNSKLYFFAPQVVLANDDLTGVDFRAIE